MVKKAITMIVVWIVPLLIDAVALGVRRWARSKTYKRYDNLSDHHGQRNHLPRYHDRY